MKGLSIGGAGGSDGLELGESRWQLGLGFNFTYDATTPVKGGGLLGVFFQDVRPPLIPRKSATPVVIGIVYVPTSDAPPPVIVVPVIEFYAEVVKRRIEAANVGGRPVAEAVVGWHAKRGTNAES